MRLTCVDAPPSAWHGQSLERKPLFSGKILGVWVTRGGGVIPHISEEGGSTLALAPLPPACSWAEHGSQVPVGDREQPISLLTTGRAPAELRATPTDTHRCAQMCAERRQSPGCLGSCPNVASVSEGITQPCPRSSSLSHPPLQSSPPIRPKNTKEAPEPPPGSSLSEQLGRSPCPISRKPHRLLVPGGEPDYRVDRQPRVGLVTSCFLTRPYKPATCPQTPHPELCSYSPTWALLLPLGPSQTPWPGSLAASPVVCSRSSWLRGAQHGRRLGFLWCAMSQTLGPTHGLPCEAMLKSNREHSCRWHSTWACMAQTSLDGSSY